MSESHKPRAPNALIHAKSPYLLQHAYNPVRWLPWGEEAFRLAREGNKPIFLSVGYAACHWCHVMEKESFEDENIAKILNEHFVPVKVDREEHPDVDELYMKAVMLLTGQGGWPLNVFLTPDLKPFYGGTYFPPRSRHGLPSFEEVLRSVVKAWQEKPGEVSEAAEELTRQLTRLYESAPAQTPVSPRVLDDAYENLAAMFDQQSGGFGRAPKFPLPSYLLFLLRYHHRTGKQLPLTMVVKTLKMMADGGIYDHLAGGFHRYSTDERWLIPHFEKMLYDNALLAQAYLEAYQLTGDGALRRTASGVLDWVLKEMTHPEGGFYSAQDADSNGQEGAYYVWSFEEVKAVLGDRWGEVFCRYYGVTPTGNFEGGKSVLHITKGLESLASQLGLNPRRLEEELAEGRRRLLEARSRRPKPLTDDKILSSWNGLMISAFAKAYQLMGDPKHLDAAVSAANFILDRLYRGGELLHRYRTGEAAIRGYLDDYAFMALAFLDLYESTFDLRWLLKAEDVAHRMVDTLWDGVKGGFFLSAEKKELVGMIKEAYDGPVPSGNSAAALALLRLAEFTGNQAFRKVAEKTLLAFWRQLESEPTAHTYLLCAVDFYTGKPKQIVVVGERGAEDTVALVREVYRKFLPNRVLVGAAPDEEESRRVIPLLQGRGMVNGKATVYVCENYACKLPVKSVEELRAQLSRG